MRIVGPIALPLHDDGLIPAAQRARAPPAGLPCWLVQAERFGAPLTAVDQIGFEAGEPSAELARKGQYSPKAALGVRVFASFMRAIRWRA